MFHVIDVSEKPAHRDPISFSKLVFNDIDADRDGEISKQEFINACFDEESFSSILPIKLLESISSS